MSQPTWIKSVSVGLLLLSAACGTPSLMPSVVSGQNLDALAAQSTAKYGMGALITRDEPDISAENGMSVQAELPESVDLRPQMSPVANQGHFGSCTAFATIKGFREWLCRKEGRPTELSPRFFWYASRKFLDQKTQPDAGDQAKMHNTGLPTGFAMNTLKVWGTVAEKSFPYPTLAQFASIGKLPEAEQDPALDQLAAVEPPKAMFEEAKRLKVDQTIYTIGSIRGMRKAFSEGKPVVIAARLFTGFQSANAAKTGMIPVPNLKTDKEIGGHAMCAVGFDNKRKVIIVRNSWGTNWGDGGHCYIPYEYFKLKDSEGRALVRGGWTIR
ncbi:MAG: C1 family peptidase [Candidatus Sericytochromatia bacterium]|nr:C1 family peptidase [Candidatus Sericytochromatia bacterium]